jgi:hypothetical protein
MRLEEKWKWLYILAGMKDYIDGRIQILSSLCNTLPLVSHSFLFYPSQDVMMYSNSSWVVTQQCLLRPVGFLRYTLFERYCVFLSITKDLPI